MLFLKEWKGTKATPNLVYSRFFPKESFFVELFRLSCCYKRGFTDDAILTKLSFREILLKDMKEISMIHPKKLQTFLGRGVKITKILPLTKRKTVVITIILMT